MVRLKVGISGSSGTRSEATSQNDSQGNKKISIKFNKDFAKYSMDKISYQNPKEPLGIRDFFKYIGLPSIVGFSLGVLSGVYRNQISELIGNIEYQKQRRKTFKKIDQQPIILDLDRDEEEKPQIKVKYADDCQIKSAKLGILNARYKVAAIDIDPEKARWGLTALMVPSVIFPFIIGYNMMRRKGKEDKSDIESQIESARIKYIKEMYKDIKDRNKQDDLSYFLSKRSMDLSNPIPDDISYQQLDEKIDELLNVTREYNQSQMEKTELEKSSGMVKQAFFVDTLIYTMFPGVLLSAITGSPLFAALNLGLSGAIFTLAAYNSYMDNIDRGAESKLKEVKRMSDTILSKDYKIPIILKYKKDRDRSDFGQTLG